MKKTVLLALLITLVSIANAQQNYLKINNTPLHEFPGRQYHHINGDLLITGAESETGFLPSIYNGTVWRFDLQGRFINKYIYGHYDYESNIVDIINISDSSLLVGYSDTIINGEYSSNLWITLTDSNMNASVEKLFKLNFWGRPQKSILVNDSLLYVLIAKIPPPGGVSPTNYSFQLRKIRIPQLDSVEMFIPSPGLTYFPSDMIYNTNNNEIKILVQGNIPGQSNVPAQFLMDFDLSLNFIRQRHSAPDISGAMQQLSPVNDSLFLFTSTLTNHDNSVYRYIGCAKMDWACDTLSEVHYEYVPGMSLYPAYWKSTCRAGDNIFIAGFYNWSPFQNFWQSQPTWIQVTKLDSNLNIISQHYYGDDITVFGPRYISAMPDGGVIITGLHYDYTIPDNQQWDIFLLRLDSNGLITNLPQNPSFRMTQVIVYPNPGSDRVTIQSGIQTNGAEFRLLDMHGKVLLSQTLTGGEQTLNTASLPAGTYPWQVIYKGQIIETGKWVKNQR